jgi:L-threonylcarbamoyladenylate synthase
MQIRILPANAAAITQVVKDLRAGQPVAIPTETVYGLAADAMNPDAIRKIFSLKGRPNNHPVIVHIAPPGKIKSELSHVAWSQLLSHWARDVPGQALQLAQAFWPGPLTMILPKAKDVLNELTGGQETVGLRCPSHPVVA